ncbi:hypothetical protein EI94DRAFT_1813760 [Lactarius quietus]|nr:hypothetical protein EI94DRAFT_1813760 [Lactarius quietus]
MSSDAKPRLPPDIQAVTEQGPLASNTVSSTSLVPDADTWDTANDDNFTAQSRNEGLSPPHSDDDDNESVHLDDDADIMDANAYKALCQMDPPAPVSSPEMVPPDDGDLSLAPPPDNASDVPGQPEMGNTETSSILTVKRFPYGQPGTPRLIWAPFRSQCNWELAHWAKMHGPTLSAVTDLLAIPGLVNGLGLSYHTSKELNSIIDKQLLGSGTPAFKTQDLEIGGEHLQFHYHEIIPCIWALLGNPEFANDLIFTLE